jgi:DNA-directed RNA polymerase subunit N (RpoN/RPB10)
MLYAKCPTCKTVLADKQVPLEEEMANICNNSNLNDNQKDKKKSELLDKLEIRNVCCRMRAITYIDLIKIIK